MELAKKGFIGMLGSFTIQILESDLLCLGSVRSMIALNNGIFESCKQFGYRTFSKNHKELSHCILVPFKGNCVLTFSAGCCSYEKPQKLRSRYPK